MKRGLAQFQQGKFVSARLDFTDILTRFEESEQAPFASVMLAKSFFRLGDYVSAEETAKTLREKYPSSGYGEWTDYFIAACHFKNGDIEQSANILASLAKKSSDEMLKAHSLSALGNSIRSSIDADTFDTILRKYEVTLDSTMPSPQQFSEHTAFSPHQERSVWQQQSTIRIGLLTSLSGVSEEEGNELYRGVAAAFERHGSIEGIPIELIVEDSASDPIQAVKGARRLIEKGVIAIIGPVYSESTMTAALVADNAGIPFIAPTAPDIGIPEIGPYVFQITLTPVVQAEALARFAKETLGFQTTALITSSDWWGRAVEKTYRETFESSGGVVVASETFGENANQTNFNDILLKIRESAPEAPAMPDSLVVFDYGNAFPDTVVVIPDPRTITQQLKPVTTIDCILISALHDDAVPIVRLIRDYLVRTTLLGDSGWSDDLAAEELGQYGEGSYLISTSAGVSSTYGSSLFTDDFEKRINDLRDIVSRKGYDAAALLIHCLMEGTRDPETMRESLTRIDGFHGLSLDYTIDPERRINTAATFVKLQNGTFIPVSKPILPSAQPHETELENSAPSGSSTDN